MKPPNHGRRQTVTVTDDGDEIEFEGYMLLCGPGPAGFTGHALRMNDGDLLYVESHDRIEILP